MLVITRKADNSDVFNSIVVSYSDKNGDISEMEIFILSIKGRQVKLGF